MKLINIFSKSVSIIVGVMFLVIGLIIFLKYDPAEYDVKATGKIVDIEEHYEYIGDDPKLVRTVFIDYTVDGKKYEHIEFIESDSNMKIGDEVEFFYMSKDPTQIAGTDKEKAPYVGLIFAVIGAIILAVTAIKIIKKKPM